MLRGLPKGPQSGDGDLMPEQVGRDALAGIERETFLILPHPQVLGYMRNKTENYDRWIAGMAKIQARMREAQGSEWWLVPSFRTTRSGDPESRVFLGAQLRTIVQC